MSLYMEGKYCNKWVVSPYLNLAFNSLLFALILVKLIQVVVLLCEQPERATDPLESRFVSSPLPQSQNSYDINDLVRFDLFGKEIAPAPKPATISSLSVPEARNGLTVVGMAVNSDSQASSALIQTPSQEVRFVKVGDLVDGEIRIEKIDTECVVVRRSDGLEKLTFRKNDGRIFIRSKTGAAFASIAMPGKEDLTWLKSWKSISEGDLEKKLGFVLKQNSIILSADSPLVLRGLAHVGDKLTFIAGRPVSAGLDLKKELLPLSAGKSVQFVIDSGYRRTAIPFNFLF